MSLGGDMGGAGFEPAKAVPPDLQSGPFGRLGIHPYCRSLPVFPGLPLRYRLVGSREVVANLPESALRRGRAGGETRTHNPRFTKPMLCRLSYASFSIVGIVSRPSQRPETTPWAVKSSTIPERRGIARLLALPRRKTPIQPGHGRTGGARGTEDGDIIPAPPRPRQGASAARSHRRAGGRALGAAAAAAGRRCGHSPASRSATASMVVGACPSSRLLTNTYAGRPDRRASSAIWTSASRVGGSASPSDR